MPIHEPGFGWGNLLIVVAMFVPFAIGNYFIAGRMGRSRAVWVVLTLVPVVNFVFMYYVIYAVVLYILDRLNDMAGRRPAA